jgi:LysM repeat protein
MFKNRQLSFAIVLLLCAALVLAACDRSASTDVVPATSNETGGGDNGGDQAATDAASMNLNLTVIAGQTQTAQVVLSQGLVATSTPTPAVIINLPTVTPAPPAATLPPVNPSQYTVQPGDWLYKIARDHGITPQALIAANPQINQNAVLQPGTVLNLPGAAAPAGTGGGDSGGKTYTVKLGDNLFRIALNNGTTYQKLAELNAIGAPFTVFPGQVIKLP